MADQLDALRRRPLQHVDALTVLRLLVHVDRHQAVEVVAEVAGHADRLEQDLRQHHGAAEVDPDAVLHRRDHGAQPAEVDQRRLAQGGAGNVRVHVDDVGAQGDVDGAGDAGAVGGQHQAGLGVGTVELVEVPAQGGAQAQLVLGAGAGGDGKSVGRLAGHAELPGRQLAATSSLVLPATASSKS